MRVKRQKKHRRAVRFFTTCFGFRQPFKVLCDGTFVHHLLVQDIMPADKALADVLGGTAKLFTTSLLVYANGCSCVIEELDYLGYETHKKNKKKSGSQDASDQNGHMDNPYLESCRLARKLGVARCGHEKRIGAEACFLEVIGADNPEHFFVATQDAELRNNLQQKPGVPLLYGLHKALLLETPSAFQKEFAAASEEKRLHMTQLEHKLLKKRVDKDSVAGGTTEGDLNGNQKVNHGRKPLGVSDKPQFKRKKAKAPNPLSCKKKKNRAQENGATKKGDKDQGDSSKRSRSRNRKKSLKGKTAAEADS
ncbi:unnamed protein product [Rhodiola kirilowii]